MLGVFAEFETTIRKERQLESIEKATVAGVYKGRKVSVNAESVRKLKAAGTKPAAIVREVGIRWRQPICR